MTRFTLLLAWTLLLSGTLSGPLSAEVSRIEIEKREPVLEGSSFGPYGAYEYIRGRVWFTVDPANLYNSRITDLLMAGRNSDGMVEASANFEVLQPVNRELSRGMALLEVSNRGGKASLRYFNRARGGNSIDVNNPSHFGDSLLMRQGITLIWVGWQFDVADSEDIMRLVAPAVTDPSGSRVEGLVRSDWTVDAPVNTLTLGHRQQTGYPVSDPADERNVLTVRDSREGPRRVVPREQWQFGRIEGGEVIADAINICAPDGFAPGNIYELVYVSDQPVVTGMGLAAVRDMISYARYNPECPFPVKHGMAVGISQTGRFLRHFLYQGFNTDERGRMAFDGMMIITAGAGRGSFNHRFAQPSRDAHRYSAFFYPTDIFPFTSSVVRDEEQWRSDGLMAHMWNDEHIPKIFYCNTGYEYWGRAASLIHTDPDGLIDIPPLESERIYLLASGQHYVGPQPGERNRMGETELYRGNPLDFSVNYRSLLVHLAEWVDSESEPPASSYPLISDGSLVYPSDVWFPTILDVKLPEAAHVAYLADYGPRWNEGIIDYQPPYLTKPFPSLVPAVDIMGNDIAGIRNVEIAVPLGTYFPWNLRSGFPGGENELTDFTGTFIPLQKDIDAGYSPDTRYDIKTLYKDVDDYMEKVEQAVTWLVESGYVLEEDIEYLTAAARKRWNRIAEQKP
jgi:hypothetical protein